MGARMKGDFGALAGFMRGLKKLDTAARDMAIKLAPKVSALVGETMAAQESPTGEAWPATQSGAPAFGGSGALGYVLSRPYGKSSVRTTVLYPLHFHQDGTRRVGRKAMAKIRRAIAGAAGKRAAAAIKVPPKRKGESDFAYQQRLAAGMARRAARKEAVRSVKHQVAFAIQQARDASGWHDPPRPLIPDESDAIPDRWDATIRDVAREVMTSAGAQEKR